MNERQVIADLLSALEYHTEQTRPIEFSRVAIEAAREYLRKPAQPSKPDFKAVPLTDEDLIECERLADIRHRKHMGSIRGQQLSPADQFLWHYARAIEAKLREKNA